MAHPVTQVGKKCQMRRALLNGADQKIRNLYTECKDLSNQWGIPDFTKGFNHKNK